MDLNAFLVIRTFERVIVCFVTQQPKSGSGRLIAAVSVAHTHTQQDFFKRVISSSQRPLPTQQIRKTNISALSGIGAGDPSNGEPQTYALDRTATATGQHDKIIK